MAGRADYIPGSEERFNTWSHTLVDYILSNNSNWNTPEDAFSELLTLLEHWEEALLVANTPTTRTKAAVSVKNEARKNFEAEIRRTVKAYITYNPAVSAADRDNMGLPIHKTTHTPAPAPQTIPEFRVDTSIIRRLTIHFQDAGSKSKAKPDGIHGCEVKWAMLAAPPATMKDIINSSFDTNSPLTLEFDEPERGKSVYLCLRWENTRGDKGPWSDIVMAIVP